MTAVLEFCKAAREAFTMLDQAVQRQPLEEWEVIEREAWGRPIPPTRIEVVERIDINILSRLRSAAIADAEKHPNPNEIVPRIVHLHRAIVGMLELAISTTGSSDVWTDATESFTDALLGLEEWLVTNKPTEAEAEGEEEQVAIPVAEFSTPAWMTKLLEAADQDESPDAPINRQMLVEVACGDESIIGRTQRVWGTLLGCSHTTIGKQPAWNAILKLRAARRERAKDRAATG